MLNYRSFVKILVCVLAFLIAIIGFNASFASSVVTTTNNSSLNQRVNSVSGSDTASNLTLSSNATSSGNETISASSQSYTVGTTNSTTLQSVKQVDNSSSSIADINLVLNALLIAIGIVLILLSIAILIRLKK